MRYALLARLTALAALLSLAAPPARAASPLPWTDPDGKPLPFATEQELLEFLRTAEVKKQKELGEGINHPTKLLLEKDGVRVNAVFRDVDVEKATATFEHSRGEIGFRDSYLFEPAAYELCRLLGYDNVPPATLRRLGSKGGSVQVWVENAMTETKHLKDKVETPDLTRWNKQVQMMNVFDALIANTDRNRGNMLITADWKIWWIDHTRAFRRNKVLLKPEGLRQCERGFLQRLRTLDEAAVRARLKDYLRKAEIDAVLVRRKVIVEQIDKLIAEQGEARVLYNYEGPEAAAPAATPAAD